MKPAFDALIAPQPRKFDVILPLILFHLTTHLEMTYGKA